MVDTNSTYRLSMSIYNPIKINEILYILIHQNGLTDRKMYLVNDAFSNIYVNYVPAWIKPYLWL